MRPYIICHMMASLDGRIDCEMTEQIDDTNHYYEALAQLGCPSTLEGKTTLAMHYAQDGVFQQQRPHEDAGQQLYKAVEAASYAIGVDTRGTLLWDDNTTEIFGRPLLMILILYYHWMQWHRPSFGNGDVACSLQYRTSGGGRWRKHQRFHARPRPDRRGEHDVRLWHRRTRGYGCCFRWQADGP